MRREYKKKPKLNVYFDTETYYDWSEAKPKSSKTKIVETLPLVVPYLIGACTDEPNSYEYFIGRDASHQFIRWLFDISEGYQTTLWAFNVDYDFQAIKTYIRPAIDEVTKTKTNINYRMTKGKKFICGSISNSKLKVSIQIRDFWVWDKTMSLKKHYEIIRKLASNEDHIGKKWRELLDYYNLQDLKKIEYSDYVKHNMFEYDGELYYYNEDWEETKLNLQLDLKYLKNDVIGLPLIRIYQYDFRDILIKTLKLDEKIDWKSVSSSYSVPSFGRLLSETYLNTEFEALYRNPVSVFDYAEQDKCYMGGFTANHKDIYALENCLDSQGNPKIECYDVNSMYPSVMVGGLPYGTVLSSPPETGEYVTWYTIYFEKEWEPGVLYKYKPEYDQLNNTFFSGTLFNVDGGDDLCGLGKENIRYFILKELYEMFIEVCDSHIVLDTSDIKYQALSTQLTDFIHTVYKFKSDTTKTKYERDQFKLLLNSLYGKLGERFRKDYYAWDADLGEYHVKPNERGDRDSILAGLYVTAQARLIMWQAIKLEIDNGNTILSCDTDSIKLIRNNPVKIEVDPTKLGAWKFEGEATHFYHNGKLKKYFFYNAKDPKQTKIALSGFEKKDVVELPVEDVKTLFNPNYNVLFEKMRNTTHRNKYWQTIITKSNIEFNHAIGHITHIYKNGRVVPYETKN